MVRHIRAVQPTPKFSFQIIFPEIKFIRMTSVQAFVLVAFGLALVLQRIVRHLRRQKQLPPGPRGWPLIGNFKDTASAHLKTWEHFYTFKDMYGRLTDFFVSGDVID